MMDYFIGGIIIAFMIFVFIRGIKKLIKGEATGCGSGCKGCPSSSSCIKLHQEERADDNKKLDIE